MIIHWLSNLFTLQYGPYFVAGLVSAYGYQIMKCLVMHRKLRIKWRPIVIIVSVITFMYITIQTQESADCIRAFQVTLKTRSIIQEENDHWSQVQRTALAEWIFEILNPPHDIAEIRKAAPADPRVTDWATTMTSKYSEIIQNAQQEQERNMAERRAHPLPEPTCGK